MLFRPKLPPSWRTRFRLALWPRRSFARSARYLWLRVMRMTGTRERLAMGVAVGVFVATLPLPGVQLALAATCAWLLGGNIPAALAGTFWANPLTLPVLWLSSHWLGERILGGGTALAGRDVLDRMGQALRSVLAPGGEPIGQAYLTLWPVVKPLAVGALALGALSGLVAYYLTLRALASRRGAIGRAQVDLSGPLALPVGDLGRRTV